MNVDVGGGTSKIARLRRGQSHRPHRGRRRRAAASASTPAGRIVRVEEAGCRFGAELGIKLELGASTLAACSGARAGGAMADGCSRPCEAASPTAAGVGAPAPRAACRPRHAIDEITFSGGVSEYSMDARRGATAISAGCWQRKSARASIPGYRGSSVSTKAFAPPWSAPRNTRRSQRQHHLRLAAGGVAAAQCAGDGAACRSSDEIDRSGRCVQARSRRCSASRSRRGRQPGRLVRAVAWLGDFQRLDAFCKGAVEGSATVLAKGHPIALAGDGDVGGLIGIHLREEMKIANADRLDRRARVKDFDYIDIGEMLPSFGRRAGGDQVADLSGERRHGTAARCARGGGLKPARPYRP